MTAHPDRTRGAEDLRKVVEGLPTIRQLPGKRHFNGQGVIRQSEVHSSDFRMRRPLKSPTSAVEGAREVERLLADRHHHQDSRIGQVVRWSVLRRYLFCGIDDDDLDRRLARIQFQS
jgi:hypothetical protein